MKKMCIIAIILLAFLTLASVSANDNATDTISKSASDEVLTDNDEQVKEDLNVSISFPDEVSKYVEVNDELYISLNGIRSEDVADKIDIYVDENLYAHGQPQSMRGYEIHPSKYSIGEHIIKANFTGNAKYNPFSVNKTFKVVEVLIKIPDEVVLGYTESICIASGRDITGTATVYVNGSQFKKVDLTKQPSNKYGTYISLIGLELGTHQIDVKYSGDKKYPKASRKNTVNVTYAMTIDNFQLYYGGNHMISIALPENVEKNPVVELDGKIYSTIKYDAPGWYYFNHSGIAPGEYNITVTYPGDAKYPKKSVETTLTILTGIFYGKFTYNGNETVTLRLPSDAKGNLSVYIDGKLFKSVELSKESDISLNGLKVGKYHITANYSGDDYDVTQDDGEISVIPAITYSPHITYGESEIITIKTNPDANATVYYYLNHRSETKHVINGSANFTIDNLHITQDEEFTQPHVLEIHYRDGDFEYDNDFDIYVDPIPSRLVGAKDITMYYGDSKTYSVKVWGDLGKVVGAGQYVKIKIGSKTYPVETDKKGNAKLKISEVPGKYTITATYHGAKATSKLVVNQPLTLKTITVKKSAKKLVLTATLKKGKTPIKNKQITFKFNGKTYKAKTNSKGIAKATIKSSVLKKLKVGKTVTYQATYLKDTVKKTAKIKK